MANSTTTSNSYSNAIAVDGEVSRDEVIVFDGAGTVLRGTILGRVAATGKLKPMATAAVDGSEVACAVLAYEVTALGAGDVAARALVRGQVNRNRLIIALDGSGVNITPAILDQLRDYGITPVDVQQVGLVS
jgi:hypothetical protein